MRHDLRGRRWPGFYRATRTRPGGDFWPRRDGTCHGHPHDRHVEPWLAATVLASAGTLSGRRSVSGDGRSIAATNQPAAALARAFRERLARLPKRVSEYIRTLDLSEYSHDVLFDFPLMVEQSGSYTVVGTEGRQVVLRAYLPSVAAHNLALGPIWHWPSGQSPPAAAPRQATTAKVATDEVLGEASSTAKCRSF